MSKYAVIFETSDSDLLTSEQNQFVKETLNTLFERYGFIRECGVQMFKQQTSKGTIYGNSVNAVLAIQSIVSDLALVSAYHNIKNMRLIRIEEDMDLLQVLK